MPPRVEGLSFKQTRALRLLALGGGAMRLGKLNVRFTHVSGGFHLDIPVVAVLERMIAQGYVRDAGLGDYIITDKGKRASDETAAAYREEWTERTKKEES